VTRCGVWIGNWIYSTLSRSKYKNYSALVYSCTLQLTKVCFRSSPFVFITRCLGTARNTVDSSVSVFTFLLATDCLIAPRGRKSWPLTSSRVWPPLATTPYRRLALASESELVRLTVRLKAMLQPVL
jgi:hypothetical protein